MWDELISLYQRTRYLAYAVEGPATRHSKLQSTFAASIMEAEYMAVFGAIQELIWIKGVLGEIRNHLVDSINLYMDSKSCDALNQKSNES